MAALAFGPIVSTTMAIRATGNSAAGVARRWVAERNRRRRLEHPAAAAADAVVPNGVTVDAVDCLGPQLSARDTVLWWVADGVTAAPWVVADIETPQFTFKSVTEQQQHVALLERSGYKLAFRRDGYIVLHRAGSGGSVSSKEASG